MTNLTFKTKAEVTSFLRNIKTLDEHSKGFSTAGTYYLAHGEYDRPNYAPCRYKDGWSIKVTHFYHAGTFNHPQDGRVNEESFTNNFLLED